MPRKPLLLIGFASLVAAMWGGLLRLGWPLPGGEIAPKTWHGALMIAGFLGTLIALERAVALGRGWYAAPVLNAIGAALLLFGVRESFYLLAAGAAILALASRHSLVMAAGALSLFAANLMPERSAAVFLWAAFPVLTIAGERLEMSKLRAPPKWAKALFVAIALLIPAGAHDLRMFGAGLIALALWLAQWDVARVTIRQRGLPRYVAVCVLSGYAWLGLAGGLAVAGGDYGVMLHAIFLGFVFPMIFAHAPIVLPAVAGAALPFHRGFYVPVALLEATLVVRLFERELGGLLNVVAILSFFAVVIATRLRSKASAGTIAIHGSRRSA